MTSLQVSGSEWVAHVASIRKLSAGMLRRRLNGGFHPTQHLPRHGLAAEARGDLERRGALLIDELIDWIDGADRGGPAQPREVRRAHPAPNGSPRRSRSATSCRIPSTPRIDFDPERLLRAGREPRLGSRARARAQRARGRRQRASPREDPDYRFAVVQSELYRRHLRLAVERLDLRPLAHYLKHLALWYLEARSQRARRARRAHAARPQRARAGPGGRADEHAAGRQLRLLHLQRVPPARGRLRRGADRGPQRRRLLARAVALGLRRDRALARARAARSAGTTSASARTSCARARSRCSASASATRASATCSTAPCAPRRSSCTAA